MLCKSAAATLRQVTGCWTWCCRLSAVLAGRTPVGDKLEAEEPQPLQENRPTYQVVQLQLLLLHSQMMQSLQLLLLRSVSRPFFAADSSKASSLSPDAAADLLYKIISVDHVVRVQLLVLQHSQVMQCLQLRLGPSHCC